MDKLNKADVLAVLKALEEGWALVDDSPDFDYLLGVSESRDELEGFYPKKEFVKQMEENGLIENPDKGIPQEQDTFTFYQGDSEGSWQPVTISDPIVYSYKITEKGHKFLYEN